MSSLPLCDDQMEWRLPLNPLFFNDIIRLKPLQIVNNFRPDVIICIAFSTIITYEVIIFPNMGINHQIVWPLCAWFISRIKVDTICHKAACRDLTQHSHKHTHRRVSSHANWVHMLFEWSFYWKFEIDERWWVII